MSLPSIILGAVIAYVALLLVMQVVTIIQHMKSYKHTKYRKDFMNKVENFKFEEEE